jgi:hypothetical protein
MMLSIGRPSEEESHRPSPLCVSACHPGPSTLSLGTNGSSARPSPAGYCFVCHGERVHDTARAIAASEASAFGAPEIRRCQQYRARVRHHRVADQQLRVDERPVGHVVALAKLLGIHS